MYSFVSFCRNVCDVFDLNVLSYADGAQYLTFQIFYIVALAL